MVMGRIVAARESGAVVDRHVVQCIGQAVVATKSPMSLVENGGSIQLTEAWAKSILIRMGFKKRCATTGKLPLPEGLVNYSFTEVHFCNC